MALAANEQRNTQRGQVKPRMTNEGCRTQANKCKDAGDFLNAMRWFNAAKARTIGHKKADRYEQAARWCAKEGGFEYKHEYPTPEMQQQALENEVDLNASS